MIVGLVTAIGCANPEDPPRERVDAGLVDAGVVRDAGPSDRDAGPSDRDAGPSDRDAGVRDAGTAPGLRLKSLNLSPAVGRAASATHHLDGRLGATTAPAARSPGHRLVGGLVGGGTSGVTQD